jgi:signal recognition particle subunit SEC65
MEELLEDLQSDLKVERQKTEQLLDALRKLDVEFDYIIMHGQMMYPNTNANSNGWIIDKLRKMKRGIQESLEID